MTSAGGGEEEWRGRGESESEIGRVRNWLKGSRVFRRHSFPGNQ
jgi:hypothetical protein